MIGDDDWDRIRIHYGDFTGLYDTGQAIAHLRMLIPDVFELRAKLTEAERRFDAAIAQRDTEAKARNELEAKLAAAQRELAHYENAINWGTACLNCSRLLDRLYAAEAVVEAAKAWRALFSATMDFWHREVVDLANAVDALAAAEINVGPSAPSSNEDGTDVGATGERCEQCGQPIEWRDDIDWWVHVDAGHDTHMPPNPRDQQWADSRAGQAGKEVTGT